MTSATRGTKRTYNQWCAIANGLDRIGERWSLLIVRELLLGPKRYKHLAAALPGMAPNLLTHRLRELESLGLVERSVLPPPASSSVYQLTPAGEALQPVVTAIGHWGARFTADRPAPTEAVIPSAFMYAMRGCFDPQVAGTAEENYEIRLGANVYGIRIRDRACMIREGKPAAPATVIETDLETLGDLLWQRISTADASGQSRARVTGPPEALDRLVALFPLWQVPHGWETAK